MSWQLLIPVVEKLIDAGVDYYKSDTRTLNAVAPSSEEAAVVRPSATILLVVEPGDPAVEVDESTLLDLVKEMVEKGGLKLVTAEVKVAGDSPSGA